MFIEVVTKTHGPRLHRPNHHKSRQGHRVITAIDVLQPPPEPAPGYTFSARQIQDAKEFLLRRRTYLLAKTLGNLRAALGAQRAAHGFKDLRHLTLMIMSTEAFTAPATLQTVTQFTMQK